MVKKDLVLSHMSLAKTLAKVNKRNYPRFQLDELESAAYFGLVLAANAVKDESKFEKYAVSKIKGGIVDYIRECNIGWNRHNPTNVVALDHDIEEKLDNKRLYEKALDLLDEDTKEIFRLYYEQNMTMKEIGDKIGLSESMISIRMKRGYELLIRRKSEIR